jgi:putative redox protein
MVKIEVVYQGDKHSQITHGPSSAVLETDAPKDNNGRGESFSPTDLVAAALGSCMVTVMAISAEKEGIDMRGAKSSVIKEMVANPRRISRLSVEIEMPKTVPASAREKLEHIAQTCPVAKSINQEIAVPINFKWL